jgi:hypothetical protein
MNASDIDNCAERWYKLKELAVGLICCPSCSDRSLGLVTRDTRLLTTQHDEFGRPRSCGTRELRLQCLLSQEVRQL